MGKVFIPNPFRGPIGEVLCGGAGGGSSEQRPYITPYEPFTGGGSSYPTSKEPVTDCNGFEPKPAGDREKLAKLLEENPFIIRARCDVWQEAADWLLAHGVTVQETAHWENVIPFGGECIGYCSKCCTAHKSNSRTALMYSYRHCKWCGARLLPQPPEGE